MCSFNFVHTADLHLGYQQYGLVERFRDFGDVFSEVADFAIKNDSDFFLISGDVFDDRNINAMTFSQSFEVLKKLEEDEVSVFAIEGNHDKAYYSEGMSWLEALDHQGLLNLIKVKSNNYLDLLGDFRELEVNGELIRIFGIKYLGVRTAELIPRLSEEIKKVNKEEGEADFTILMMHFGLDDQTEINLGRGYSYKELLPLKDVVDYLALGHYHVGYEVDDWVFNPGSLEDTKMNEVGYSSGFYFFDEGNVDLMEVEGDRSFENIRIDVGDYDSSSVLLEKIEETAAEFDISSFDKKPVVNVVFEGDLRFRREDLPIEEVKDLFSDKSIHVNTKILTSEEKVDFGDFESEGKKKIERDVLKRLVGIERPSFEEKSDLVSDTLIRTKKMAVRGSNSQDIIDVVKECYNNLDSGGCEEESDEKEIWNWKEAY